MQILHTESSSGWGGQEIRILKESEGMRARGHEVIMAVTRGGGLIARAREKGFIVYELDFSKLLAPITLIKLLQIIKKHQIDIINTHSSLDAWIAGIAGRIAFRSVVRTRHLSTPTRAGLNSRLLYGKLADFVVTTSSAIIPEIQSQSNIAPEFCRCIATGVNPDELSINPEAVLDFRKKQGIKESDLLVGTACFVRSWKGIQDFMHAAHLLKEHSHIKWIIVGGGYVDRYRGLAEELKLNNLIFTGHLEPPYAAIAAMDIFVLLSTANEGISQSSLQAAFLQKPLITTPIGGLPEVCINGETGLLVSIRCPAQVAEAVLTLEKHPHLRKRFGQNGRHLVESKFTFEHTLNQMEDVYKIIHQTAS